MVAFEAAVAGGVPIIKALREGLTANRIEWIAGIINGTCNFILSEMRETALPFDTVLKEAQRAAATPRPTRPSTSRASTRRTSSRSSSAIAFGIPMQFDKAYVEGITKLTREDLQVTPRSWATGSSCSASRGARRRASSCGCIRRSFRPARLIANVEGAMNAMLVKGDAVGPTLYYGAGAGAEPTASAVIADLVDVTRMHTADPEQRVPHLAFQPDQLTDVPILPMGDVRDQLLPAHARRRPPGRACRHHAHPRRPWHLDRRDDPEGAGRGRGPDRHHPAHPRIASRARRRRDRRASRRWRRCAARSCASGWRSA